MSLNGSHESPVRYFCTAGKGMEKFLVQEVTKKLEAEEVTHLVGKVFFISRAKINKIVELKSAERIFLLVKKDAPLTLTANMNSARAASSLKSRLLADPEVWKSAAVTWAFLKGELSDFGLKKRVMKEEFLRESEDQKAEKEVTVDVLERKRKRREDESEDERSVVRTKRKESVEVPGKDEVLGGSEESTTEENVEKPSADTLVNNTSISDDQKNSDKVSFRINPKCSGSLSRCLSVQTISQILGCGLSRTLDWKVDLKNPQLEVSVYLSDDFCLLGIPLTRLPLANRSYIKTTGLRSTVAWAMGSLAHIQPGCTVVDPMCGVGTLLIEAAQEHKDVHFLGVDIDDGQLQKASENVAFASFGNRIHLLKASSMALPLATESVDVVICDLPFGRKFSTKASMMAALPRILVEMERILRVGGRLVLLLTPQLSCLLKKLVTPRVPGPSSQPDGGSSSTQNTGHPSCPPPSNSLLEHQETRRVSLGTIDGLMHKYLKTKPLICDGS